MLEKTIVDSILLNTEVHLHQLRLNVQQLILVEQFKHDSFNSICFSLEKDELLERFRIPAKTWLTL